MAPAQPAFEPLAHATGPARNYGLGGAFARDLDGDGLLDLVVSATYDAANVEVETPILVLDPRDSGRTKAVLAVGGQRAAAYPVPRAPWGDGRGIVVVTDDGRASLWSGWPLRAERSVDAGSAAPVERFDVANVDGDPALELLSCSGDTLVVVDLATGAADSHTVPNLCLQAHPVAFDGDAAAELLVVTELEPPFVYDVEQRAILATAPQRLRRLAIGQLDTDAPSELVVQYVAGGALRRIDLAPGWTETVLQGASSADAYSLWDLDGDGVDEWLAQQNLWSVSLYSPSAGVTGPFVSGNMRCRGPVVIGQLDADAAMEAVCTGGGTSGSGFSLAQADFGTTQVEWGIGDGEGGPENPILRDLDGDGQLDALVAEPARRSDLGSRARILRPGDLSTVGTFAIPGGSELRGAGYLRLGLVAGPAPRLAWSSQFGGAGVPILASAPLPITTAGWQVDTQSPPDFAIEGIDVDGDGAEEILRLSGGQSTFLRRCTLTLHAASDGRVLWQRPTGGEIFDPGVKLLVVRPPAGVGAAPSIATACAGRVTWHAAADGVARWTRDLNARDLDLVDGQRLLVLGADQSTLLDVQTGSIERTLPGAGLAVVVDRRLDDVVLHTGRDVARADLETGNRTTPIMALVRPAAVENLIFEAVPGAGAGRTRVIAATAYGLASLEGPAESVLFSDGFELR
jgi:hypothetical protein